MKSENEKRDVELLKDDDWVSDVRVVEFLEADEFLVDVRVVERREDADPFLKKVEVVEVVVDLASASTNPVTWFKWLYMFIRWLKRRQ